MKRILLLLMVFSLLTSISCQNVENNKQEKVQNIILLIGDGMGVTQVYSGMSVSKELLNIERSQYFGYSKTYSSSDYVTDSGAGATALATGKKSYNGAIAVSAGGKVLKSITEYAIDAGFATGVVATCELFHATPASFITHDISRNNDYAIARKITTSKLDILIGGGALLFDSLGVTDSLQMLGYQIQPDITKIDVSSNMPVFSVPYPSHPPRFIDGRGDFLVDATKIAMQKLNAYNKGFFLMVEGSQIDWGGHEQDIDYVNSEMLDFDRTIGAAYDFADENPGTLVIVTADHECGGLTIPNGSIEDKTIEAVFSTGGHTGVMVPVFAYGAGAEEFSAIMENTEIFDKMISAFDF